MNELRRIFPVPASCPKLNDIEFESILPAITSPLRLHPSINLPDDICLERFFLQPNTPLDSVKLYPGIICPPTPPPDPSRPLQPFETVTCRICNKTYNSNKTLGSLIRFQNHPTLVQEALNNPLDPDEEIAKGYTCLLCARPPDVQTDDEISLTKSALKIYLQETRPKVRTRNVTYPLDSQLITDSMKILARTSKHKKKSTHKTGDKRQKTRKVLVWECQLCKVLKHIGPTEDTVKHLDHIHSARFANCDEAEKQGALCLVVDEVLVNSSEGEGTEEPASANPGNVTPIEVVGGIKLVNSSLQVRDEKKENVLATPRRTPQTLTSSSAPTRTQEKVASIRPQVEVNQKNVAPLPPQIETSHDQGRIVPIRPKVEVGRGQSGALIDPVMFVNNGRMEQSPLSSSMAFNSLHTPEPFVQNAPPSPPTPPQRAKKSMRIVNPVTHKEIQITKVVTPAPKPATNTTPSPPSSAKKSGIKIMDPRTGQEKIFTRQADKVVIKPSRIEAPRVPSPGFLGHRFRNPDAEDLVRLLRQSRAEPEICPRCQLYAPQMLDHFALSHGTNDPALVEAQEFITTLDNGITILQQQHQQQKTLYGSLVQEGEQATRFYGNNTYTIVHPDHRIEVLNKLTKFIHLEDTLISKGFMTRNGTASDDEQYMKCSNCGRPFKWCTGTDKESCYIHTGQAVRQNDNIAIYDCCYASANYPFSKGCNYIGPHYFTHSSTFTRRSLFRTAPGNPHAHAAISIDCEMAETASSKSEIIQICIIDLLSGQTLVNTLVYPRDSHITNYRTQWSGVDESMMSAAFASGTVLRGGWEEARQVLFSFIGPETIITGHAVHNDLECLRVAHRNVVDTQIAIAEFANGTTFSLKDACLYALDKVVQMGAGVHRRGEREQHDCEEDTLATREVILWLVGKTEVELKEWAGEALMRRKRSRD